MHSDYWHIGQIDTMSDLAAYTINQSVVEWLNEHVNGGYQSSIDHRWSDRQLKFVSIMIIEFHEPVLEQIIVEFKLRFG
jgi:hypothetical protein